MAYSGVRTREVSEARSVSIKQKVGKNDGPKERCAGGQKRIVLATGAGETVSPPPKFSIPYSRRLTGW